MQHTMDLKAIAHTRQLHKHILVKVKHQQTFLHQAEFLLLTHPVFVNTFFFKSFAECTCAYMLSGTSFHSCRPHRGEGHQHFFKIFSFGLNETSEQIGAPEDLEHPFSYRLALCF